MRFVLHRADRVFVLAERFSSSLRAIGVRTGIDVESTFVDDTLFGSVDLTAFERRSGSRVLFLSRILKSKGIFEALEALRRVQLALPETELVVAGDGPDLEAARSYVEVHGIKGVRFVGAAIGTEKRDLFLESDVFLFPSHGEGFPIVVLEAMATGLPLVTTRVGAIPDFFRDGEMGFSVDVPDPDTLADRLLKLLRNPTLRRAISETNVRYAQDRFLASRAAERMATHYAALSAPH
jgi:glycosyltransferase involved in cell wall biosynthesis